MKACLGVAVLYVCGSSSHLPRHRRFVSSITVSGELEMVVYAVRGAWVFPA